MIEKPQGRPPFRADHVGSLLRPPVLRQAFKDYFAKRIDDAHFAQIQDQCIRDVVKLQEDAGLRSSPTANSAAARTGAALSSVSTASYQARGLQVSRRPRP